MEITPIEADSHTSRGKVALFSIDLPSIGEDDIK